MAVTAATAIAMFVVTTVVVVATAATFVAMSSAATCQVLHQVFYLIVCGSTVLQYGTLKVQRLSCQRMVQIHLHLLLAHFHDAAVETLSLFILQWDDSFLVYVLMVEMSVDAEHLTLKVEHVVWGIVTIRLFLRQHKVERLACCYTDHFGFKRIQCNAETCNKHKGLVLWSFFHHFLPVLSVNKQFVSDG